MKYSKRVEIFKKVKSRYAGLMTSVLWKLTGDRELFAEAFQYALLAMWQNVEKLNGKKAGAYIYRIALTANSKAWQNRIGKDGQIPATLVNTEKEPHQRISDGELTTQIRKAIAQLPTKQSTAISMRYLEQKSYCEVAAKLRCSQAGARSHVSKALAALKNKFTNLTIGAD